MAGGKEERSSQVFRRSPAFKAAAKALGSRVRELRQARGWTLEQAAAAGDLDLKHWQKVEAGQLNLTLVTLLRIAEGLGEPLAGLFAPSAPPTPSTTIPTPKKKATRTRKLRSA